jgi:predicted peroxiredoxin/TusA-related sulfurtransferase
MFKYLSLVALVSLVIGCTTHIQHSEGLPMGKIPANRSIDMRGKTITPFILYYAVKKLKDMQVGEILEVNTDKFEAIENDINAWSRMTGNSLIEMETGNNYQRYFIKKVSIKKSERKLAMIISDPGLERLLSPLGLALSAALSGTDVYLYFQGPAVRVLKKNFKAKLSGIQKPFSSFARKEMARAGHLPPQDKLEQLKEMGARIYICGGSMNPFGVKKSDLIFDDVIIAEYLTFLEIMDKADIHIFLQ